MAITINGKTYRNLQQQVLQNMNDIAEIKEHGTGESYSAGTGISISDENVISIDNTVETKANATNRFVSKTNLTDYSINEIIVGNSEVDADNVDLRAVYSQDVKSEVSLDPTSTIIRTMSGTDTSTIGISATEIDITTPMLKYGTSEVATKADIPTYTEGQGITITNSNEIKANIGYGLEFSATESDTDEIKINTNVIATKEDIPTKTSDLTNDSDFITIADVPVPTAGTGIDITNGQISVDNTVAMKTDLVDYHAGTNVSFGQHTGGGYDINVPIKTINGNSLAGTGDVSVAALTEASFRVNLRTGNPTIKTWYYTFRAEATLDTTKTGTDCLYSYVPVGAVLYCIDDNCLYSVVSVIPNGQTTIAKYDGTTTVYITPSFVNTTVERL